VDETYIKVKGAWMYWYPAVDSAGKPLEFWLGPRRDAAAAKRFFQRALGAAHTFVPRVITVDKNAAYPKAHRELPADGSLPEICEVRQVKYLNKFVEQDHRFIKRLVQPGLGFFSFDTAGKTFQGYEGMNIIRKGQVQGVGKGDIICHVAFIARLFGGAASAKQEEGSSCSSPFHEDFLQQNPTNSVPDEVRCCISQ
jgi:transposase-like protein